MKSKIFAINGEEMISPESVSVQYESLADPNSGRTDDGIMHINYIWRRIRKVIIKLPPLKQEEISNIFSKIQGQEYDLTYLDIIKGMHTIKCYTSNSSADLYSGVWYGGLWRGASFSAIELAGEK